MESFPTPNIFLANPHLYDYFYSLDFRADNTVELADGAGQVINTIANGKYAVQPLSDNSAEIIFTDIVEVHPYSQAEIRQKVNGFRVRVKKEEGVFAFRQDVIWNVPNEEEWPCLLYKLRYVFDKDPLGFGRSNRRRNPYYRLNKLGGEYNTLSTRHYYSNTDRQRLTLKELLTMGIKEESFIDS